MVTQVAITLAFSERVRKEAAIKISSLKGLKKA